MLIVFYEDLKVSQANFPDGRAKEAKIELLLVLK
jgi:hypothetical protein